MSFSVDLPTTTHEQPPAFASADECNVWLEKQAPDSPVQLQAALLRQLNLLNRFHLPAGERLAIMERLRGPVLATQEENAKRFAGKPLPLASSEAATFDTCQSIWNALATGYLHCLAACASQEPGLREQASLAAQRALAALVSAQFDGCRGGRLPGSAHWRRLHGAYAAAEQAEVARIEVADEPRMGRNPATPLATWVEALLLHAASLHQLPLRQMAWAARWARRWAGKVSAHASPPTMSTRAIPLCVDLDSDQPAGYQPSFVAGARFLDTSALRQSLKKRVELLTQGELPKNLQLGEDCTQPQCQELLIQLYYHWCKGGTNRRQERRPASGSCAVIGGIEAIHYYLSGHKPLVQPGKAMTDTDLRRQREEIATFGQAKSAKMDNFSEQHGYQEERWDVLEEWHLLDQATTGARITRPADRTGGRFGHGQLVAARTPDAKTQLLGTLRWVMIDATGALQAGVELIAGKPQPAAVRGTDSEAARAKYTPAFLLPAVPALEEPASIVTPPGVFKRERVLEMLVDQKASQIRLTGIIERGSDFERATYE